MRLNLGKHRVGIRVEAAPQPVWVDPGRFDQIVTNLLDNAAKYSPDATPIEITIRGVADGAEISVADQGVGIAREDLPRLFDRFFQAKRARAAKSGLGMGLYI